MLIVLSKSRRCTRKRDHQPYTITIPRARRLTIAPQSLARALVRGTSSPLQVVLPPTAHGYACQLTERRHAEVAPLRQHRPVQDETSQRTGLAATKVIVHWEVTDFGHAARLDRVSFNLARVASHGSEASASKDEDGAAVPGVRIERAGGLPSSVEAEAKVGEMKMRAHRTLRLCRPQPQRRRACVAVRESGVMARRTKRYAH